MVEELEREDVERRRSDSRCAWLYVMVGDMLGYAFCPLEAFVLKVFVLGVRLLIYGFCMFAD